MASYVWVSGSNTDNYKIEGYIPFSSNFSSPNTITPGVSGGSANVLYGDQYSFGDNLLYPTWTDEIIAGKNTFRKTYGMWFLDYLDLNKNAEGVQLEFLVYDHTDPINNYFETGKTKEFTVEQTRYYVDQDLDSVKEQLKNSTLWKKDEKINVPYTFKSKDNKITLEFNMSNDARYNIRDAYYLQQDMKTADISFFIENTPIRLPKKYIKELFIEVNEFVYNILVEYQRQILNIESSDNIYDAQVSAAWVYEGVEIPERTISN